MPVVIGILDPEDTKIKHHLESTHTAWKGIEAPPPHRHDESCYWHNVTGVDDNQTFSLLDIESTRTNPESHNGIHVYQQRLEAVAA